MSTNTALVRACGMLMLCWAGCAGAARTGMDAQVGGGRDAGRVLQWLREQDSDLQAEQASRLCMDSEGSFLASVVRNEGEDSPLLQEELTKPHMDAWGTPIEIEIDRTRQMLRLVSAGPDAAWGSEDDIHCVIGWSAGWTGGVEWGR